MGTLRDAAIDKYDEECERAKKRYEAKHDPVTLPKHYARFKIEPVRFIVENNLPFAVGNIIKYVLRWDAKDGMQDLKKARRYLDMWIAYQEGNPDWWTESSSKRTAAVLGNITEAVEREEPEEKRELTSVFGFVDFAMPYRDPDNGQAYMDKDGRPFDPMDGQNYG